ncbi:MAG: type 4a pilus biogenesis protein PilO [Myxococcales bacterium]|nr:type 4a pilus biogenesis protein PilO [Myxococcales bacterium]
MKVTTTDLAGAVVLAALLAVTWTYGVARQSKRIEDIRRRELVMYRELASTGTLAERQSQMNRNLEILTGALADYERRMPPTPQVDGFVRQLYDAAERAGLSITSVRPEAAVDRERYAIMPVDVQGIGSFQQFYAFIYEMRGIPRINKIDQLSVARGGGARKGNVTVQIKFHIFMSRARA